jgi:predicted KAP-like P-loop ATPase
MLSADGVATLSSDLLDFDRYVDPLVEVLTDPSTQTPMTVGIFGAWGSGKSSLLGMLDERLAADHEQSFVRVHFNPWVYRGEEGLLVPLLHTLHDTLMEDRGRRFVDAAKQILNVAAKLSVNVLLKRMTADAASLEQIDALRDQYAKQRNQVQSEIRNLRETLQAQADSIARKDARLVLFVDDLDRCEPDEIIDLLEMVKLFLDLRHTLIVLAVDKEVIDRGIQIKYASFAFATGREAAIGAEYLEKMVQLPIMLPALHVSRIRQYMERLKPPSTVPEQFDLLERIVAPNPRKIKRVLNILAFTEQIIARDPGLAELDTGVLARLVVMQVQDAELYAAITALPDLAIALEAVYEKDLRLDETDDFLRFGPRAGRIRELAKQYYHPETYLAELFAGSPFSPLAAELSLYLGMLGPPRPGA